MNQIAWLRVSYISGAGALLVGVTTLWSRRVGEAEFGYLLGIVASAMLAWAVLLIWADRKPMERKWVLPITVLVIVGLVVGGFYRFATVPSSVGMIVLTTMYGGLVIGLMLFSYFNARTAEQA